MCKCSSRYGASNLEPRRHLRLSRRERPPHQAFAPTGPAERRNITTDRASTGADARGGSAMRPGFLLQIRFPDRHSIWQRSRTAFVEAYPEPWLARCAKPRDLRLGRKAVAR